MKNETDAERAKAYEAFYRFARETAERADRLPEWKKPEAAA